MPRYKAKSAPCYNIPSTTVKCLRRRRKAWPVNISHLQYKWYNSLSSHLWLLSSPHSTHIKTECSVCGSSESSLEMKTKRLWKSWQKWIPAVTNNVFPTPFWPHNLVGQTTCPSRDTCKCPRSVLYWRSWPPRFVTAPTTSGTLSGTCTPNLMRNR